MYVVVSQIAVCIKMLTSVVYKYCVVHYWPEQQFYHSLFSPA